MSSYQRANIVMQCARTLLFNDAPFPEGRSSKRFILIKSIITNIGFLNTNVCMEGMKDVPVLINTNTW